MKNQHKNKAKGMKILRSRLYELERSNRSRDLKIEKQKLVQEIDLKNKNL